MQSTARVYPHNTPMWITDGNTETIYTLLHNTPEIDPTEKRRRPIETTRATSN